MDSTVSVAQHLGRKLETELSAVTEQLFHRRFDHRIDSRAPGFRGARGAEVSESFTPMLRTVHPSWWLVQTL